MKTRIQAKAKSTAGSKSSFTPIHGGLSQQKCTCGAMPGPTGKCAECRRRDLKQKAAFQSKTDILKPTISRLSSSPGYSLDSHTREFMESRFGHDFSGVRMHTDARAAESARSIDASAYTVGSHIIFGAQQYAPNSREGKNLLAHELTHVIQQTTDLPAHNHERKVIPSVGIVQRLTYSQSSDSSEREAEAVASQIGRGKLVSEHRFQQIPQQTIAPFSFRCSLEAGALTAAVLAAVATCGSAILTVLAPEPVVSKLGAVLLGIGCGASIAGILLAIGALIKCKEEQKADREEIERLRRIERKLRELEEKIERQTGQDGGE